MLVEKIVNKRVQEFEIKNLEIQLLELRSEHRDLDEIIHEMIESMHPDQLKIQRLKKRKLRVKDSITRLESLLIPDLDA
ncbi:MAG: DUF465 domain-containing protein [Xanthomonadales bacterium]|nr:DUF465 domain-containing protein [Xanthomonadales bacterium]